LGGAIFLFLYTIFLPWQIFPSLSPATRRSMVTAVLLFYRLSTAERDHAIDEMALVWRTVSGVCRYAFVMQSFISFLIKYLSK